MEAITSLEAYRKIVKDDESEVESIDVGKDKQQDLSFLGTGTSTPEISWWK